MGKLVVKFFFLIITLVISAVIFLSYVGLETDKFDSLIKTKVNDVNEHVKLEFNKTKIHLNIRNLKLLLKLQKPKVLLKNYKINLSKFDLFLSLKSFYTSDFLLEKVDIAFKENDIKDLTKVTNVFLPKIINKRLKKIFVKGNLEGELTIPFNSDGKISENYIFNGKIIEAQINITKNYKLRNFNAEIHYSKSPNASIDDLKIIVNNGKFLNLDLLKSLINVKFNEKLRHLFIPKVI